MPSRRQVLAGAASAAALAGCSGLPGVTGSDDAPPLGSDFATGTVETDAGWPAYRRDALNTGFVPDADPVGEPSVQWESQPVPETVDRFGRLSVRGATLFTGRESVLALDVVSGDRLWEQDAATLEYGATGTVDGDDDRVWAAGADDESVLALDTGSGDVQRRLDAPSRPQWAPALAPEDEYAVVPTAGETLGDQRLAGVVLNEQAAGPTVDDWTRDAFASVFYPVAVGTGVYAVANTGEVYHFSRRGAPQWRTDLDRPVRTHAAVGEERVYVGTRSGAVALAKRGGRPAWAFTDAAAPVNRDALAFDGKRVYVCAGTAVHAVSAETGGERWRHEFDDEVTALPTVAGDRVYVGTRGAVHALTTGGEHAWSVAVDGAAPSGALAFAAGRLYAFRADGEDTRVVALG